MNRYIDAIDIAKQIADFKKSITSPNSDYMTGYICAFSATEGMIANAMIASVADVVEVVRCGHCEYAEYCYDDVFDCRCPNAPWASDEYSILTNANDFCSYGERRDKNDTQVL